MILLPWKFWRDVRVTFEPRRGAMTVFILTLIALCMATVAATQASRATWWWHDQRWGTAMRATIERPYYMVYCAANPLSRTSPGTCTSPWTPGPIDLPVPLRFYIDDWRYPLKVWRSYLWFHFLIMGAFVLLPLSMRRADVRWVHLVRISTYALPYLVVPLLLNGGDVVLQVLAGFEQSNTYYDVAGWIGDIADWWLTSTPLFEFVWWSLAVSLYLKIRHGWAVGASVVTVAGLAVILIGVLQDIWPTL